MTDLTKPKFCNQGQCSNPTYIGAVQVRTCSGSRMVAFSEVCETARSGKMKNQLKAGVQFVAWHTWCLECWDSYRNGKVVRNSQKELAV